jgi:hypothetical protein
MHEWFADSWDTLLSTLCPELGHSLVQELVRSYWIMCDALELRHAWRTARHSPLTTVTMEKTLESHVLQDVSLGNAARM